MAFTYAACCLDNVGLVHTANAVGGDLYIDGGKQPFDCGGANDLRVYTTFTNKPVAIWNRGTDGYACYAVNGALRVLAPTYGRQCVAAYNLGTDLHLVHLRDGLHYNESILDATGAEIGFTPMVPTSREFPSNGIRDIIVDGNGNPIFSWFDESLYYQAGPYSLANWRDNATYVVGAANNNPPEVGEYAWNKLTQQLFVVSGVNSPIPLQIAGGTVAVSGEGGGFAPNTGWSLYVPSSGVLPPVESVTPCAGARVFMQFAFNDFANPIGNSAMGVHGSHAQFNDLAYNAKRNMAITEEFLDANPMFGTTWTNLWDFMYCSLEGHEGQEAQEIARVRQLALGKPVFATIPVLTSAVANVLKPGDFVSPYLYRNISESLSDFTLRATGVCSTWYALLATMKVNFSPLWGIVHRFNPDGSVGVTTKDLAEAIIIASNLTAEYSLDVALFRAGASDYDPALDPYLTRWWDTVPYQIVYAPPPIVPPDPQPPIPPAGSAAGIFRRSR